MKVNDIEISGVITQEDLNSYNLHYPRKEVCETFGINFSEDMPNVETPLQIFFDTKVVKSKVIYTQGEDKLFLHGIITTKIVYVAEQPSSPINTIEFYKHFSCLLPTNNIETHNLTAKTFIEDAIVTQQSNRGFYVSLLLLVCPIYSDDIDEYEEEIVEVIPKKETITKIEEPEPIEENKSISMPVENDDADIEIEYDMNMNGQYFESNWK
ncbi:hypothetical protein BD780_002923 [Clostridium tetanomorphum]|uniref:DUF3794 domain-containing protein n=1 Tax=Clostridium tetanomorphum TaxID=1553 RepID=A0A923E6A3_CLOTT|nr:DUF3794 domain-containing protein [Clostridium tetanomorphum]KAJ53734.1 hypothetical protein CTM_00655 [Clostridium tetanomorphum DSM 665]MBC2397245.1 DUF3794 domain-containing protein [Clostridium tetanomorphum]MBP1862462.1 hypothetical protein [Clostridium tetanomorphum]NRS85698.1 hypothetical protein [Clostridium tetanomorphum]NRZ96292.1 hypothetical protein [Clostridium tetanomorphum]